MARRKNKTLFSVIISIVILAVAAWQYFGGSLTSEEAPKKPAKDGTLTAYFLDVGQGDCSLFVLPDGKTLLVDAGNRGDGDEIADYISKMNVDRLDYVIATHPHADHIGGMSEVIDSLDIGQVFAPRIAADDVPTTKSYEDFLLSVKNKELKLTAAKADTVLFEGEDYRADCLSPTKTDYDNLNNYSVSIKLTFGIHSFVLTGDAERLIENEILKTSSVDCDVYKVAHHGSSGSNSPEFLKALSPEYAIISCGEDNSYGHPHSQTLSALNNLPQKPEILRTDQNKTICITTDGKTENGIKVSTELASVIE